MKKYLIIIGLVVILLIVFTINTSNDRKIFQIKTNITEGVGTIIKDEIALDEFISANNISDLISADFDNYNYYVLKVPKKGKCDTNVKVEKVKYQKDCLTIKVKRTKNTNNCPTPEDRFFLVPLDKKINSIKNLKIE